MPVIPAMAAVISAAPTGRRLFLRGAGAKHLIEHRAFRGLQPRRDKAELTRKLWSRNTRGTATTRLLDAGMSLFDVANSMGWPIYAAENAVNYAPVPTNKTDASLAESAQARGTETHTTVNEECRTM